MPAQRCTTVYNYTLNWVNVTWQLWWQPMFEEFAGWQACVNVVTVDCWDGGLGKQTQFIGSILILYLAVWCTWKWPKVWQVIRSSKNLGSAPFSALHCTALHCTAQHSTVLYRTVPYRTVPYRTVPYCTVLYCTVLYCTVLYCTVLYCTVLYCIVLYCIVLYCITSTSHV